MQTKNVYIKLASRPYSKVDLLSFSDMNGHKVIVAIANALRIWRRQLRRLLHET